MPAIKAYKHNGKIIPVDQAKVSRAYQCPWTQQLYSTKRSYIKHLKELRATRMHRRARANRWQRLGEDLWNQTSFEKIVKWVELHPEWFLNNAKRRSWASDATRFESIRDSFSINITYLQLTWSDSVSNSHSCPHTGVTNWGGRKLDAPRGYPGWQGRIEYEINCELPGFSSDIMERTRIHTGSGNGGKRSRFEVKFFDDDWPGLVKGQMWETLKGNNIKQVQLGKSR